MKLYFVNLKNANSFRVILVVLIYVIGAPLGNLLLMLGDSFPMPFNGLVIGGMFGKFWLYKGVFGEGVQI